MKKLFILLFNQSETGGSGNIDSFTGGLWVAHGAADLPVTNKELYFCFFVLLNHFMNTFLVEIVTIAYSLLE